MYQETINPACPNCRATSYRIFPDTDRQHISSGLQVHCSNKKDGCMHLERRTEKPIRHRENRPKSYNATFTTEDVKI